MKHSPPEKTTSFIDGISAACSMASSMRHNGSFSAIPGCDAKQQFSQAAVHW